MKLGTSTSVLFFYEIMDAVRIVGGLGYDGIDFWGGRPHIYRTDYSPQELQELRKLVDDHGLEVPSLMPAFYRYPHSLSSPNHAVRTDSIEYMRQCVDNAAILGAALVLVIPDHSLYNHSSEDSFDRFMESIDEVAQYTRQHEGLMLGLEILWKDETDYFFRAEDALAVIDQLQHPNLGVVLDTGTLNLSKDSVEEVFDKLEGKILQVHFNDNDGIKEQQNLIPGDGTFDFESLICHLKRIGFSGYLSAELSKGYAQEAEQALRTTAGRLRTWMDEA